MGKGSFMSKESGTFNEIVTNHFEDLDLFTTAITRAHGKSHPEAFEVRKLFEKINSKVQEAGTKKSDLNEEFSQLNEVTNNYKVPGDVCETYEAVYQMLSEAEIAYKAE